MVETKNDGVITVTLLASELTKIIQALKIAGESYESGASMDRNLGRMANAKFNDQIADGYFALAGRLDDIR